MVLEADITLATSCVTRPMTSKSRRTGMERKVNRDNCFSHIYQVRIIDRLQGHD